MKEVISFLEWFDMVVSEIGYENWLEKYPTHSQANKDYIDYIKSAK